MADDPKEDEKPPLPLGGQMLKGLHRALKALHGEYSKNIGSLDDCEAKTLIGEHMGNMETSFSGMAKAFGKLYKGVDLDEEDKPEDEKKPDEKKDDKEPERQIEKADDPKGDDDKNDSMSPTEKGMLLSKLRQLESKVRHEERLQRMARLRQVTN